MALIKLTKNTTNKEVVKKENIEKNIKKEKKFDDPKVIYEDERGKDEYISHYVLNDGTKKTVISSVPVNYYDEESNTWEEIDNTLEEESDSFVTKKRKFKTEINKTNKGKGVKLSNNKFNVSWHYLGKKNSKTVVENTKLTVNKFDSNNKKRIKNIYENVDVNTDLEYVLEGNNIKENIIVKEKSDSYEYNFLFELKGLKVRLSEDKESIEIYNDEKVEFMIPAPFMYDANGNRNDNVYYEIEENGMDSYIFTVVADKEWINSEERAFPITIDPQIVVKETDYISYCVEKRNITQSDSQTIYGEWEKINYDGLRMYCTNVEEYRSKITIKKSLISKMGDVSLAYLCLVPKYAFSCYIVVDGVVVYCNAYNNVVKLPITNSFKNSDGDFELYLGDYHSNCDVQFYASSENPINLEITYILDEHLQSTTKKINLADCATGEVNLVTGEMVTLFPLVEARNSALGIPINLINKQDSNNYFLGNNFRLNLNENLVKYDSNHYIYTDSIGKKHAFRKFYYYLESGVKNYVEKEDLIVNNDGTISWIEDYSKKIQIEYKSTNGYKLITDIEEIDNVDYIEQRNDEIRSLEEQKESYEDVFNQYLSIPVDIQNYNNYNVTYLNKNYSTKTIFESFIQMLDSDQEVLLTNRESVDYYLQNKKLTIILEELNKKYGEQNLQKSEEDEEKLELEISELEKQKTDFEIELNLYKKKSSEYIKQVKKHFRDYCVLLEKLDELYRITPSLYLTDGTKIKGYNKNGNMVIIYDNYGKYVAVEYSKTYTSESNYLEKISRIYDNLGKQVSFIYNENGNLCEIISVDGNKICLNYDYKNQLSSILGNTINVLLEYSDDNKLDLVNNKNKALFVAFGSLNNKFFSIQKYSTAQNISLNNTLENNPTFISTDIRITYHIDNSNSVIEASVTKDFITEKYVFDKDGFNTHYYLEENGKVVNAQRYIHQPYYKGDIKQEYTGDTAKTVVINAKKDTLYQYSLSDFIFEDGDSVTTTLNMFEHPLQKYTNAIAISDDCTKTSIIDYIYDQEQKLIEEKETVIFSNDNETFISYKKYTYDLYRNIIKTESYVEGEELINGKNINENIFDENGNLLKSFSYNSLDPSTKFYNESLYNESGQVVSKLDSLGVNTIEYKYLNNLVSEEVLPNGSRFGYGYDNSGNLISVTQSTIEGEENSNQKVIKYGEVVALNSNNNHVEYTYDSKRRVTKVNLNGVEGYLTATYNEEVSSGVVTKTTVTENYGSDKFIKVYDWDNKIKTIVKNNSPLVQYSYNNKRNVSQISDVKLGKYKNYTYDDYDNVTKVTVVTHNNITEYSEDISYNSFGLLESKEINNCVNHLYNYSYSNDSKMILDTITFNTDTEINLKYDINGRNKGKVISIGEDTILDEEITYLKIGDHATLLPSGIKYKGTSDNLRYSYDNMGNINKVYVNGELAIRYTYDSLNRLIREDNKVLGKTFFISYDNNGNILSKREYEFTFIDTLSLSEKCPDEDFIFIYDGDKLISYDLEEIIYDDYGKPLQIGVTQLAWEHTNLINYGNTVFTYDGLGKRTSKRSAEKGEISFTYDSNSRLIKQSNGLEFFYDNTGVAGFIYQEDKYIYRKNLLGDITDIIDNNGNIIVKYVYDSWGNHKVCDSDGNEITDESFIGNLNPFRYRGYYYDVETQLYWVSSRYYSPELCRWISPDSIEYLDPQSINGLNLYVYCGNDPINRFDPTGHSWESFWNSVGDWFSDHWKEVVIGTAFIVGGALVTALTAGAGVGFMAAFGSALLSSTIQVGISVGTSVLVGGLVSVANGGGFFDNVGDNIASAYMWGGIFSGGAQILGGGFRIAANKGVTTGRAGGIKLGNSGVKILSPDKNNWAKAGGTLIKFGNGFRIDTGAMWGLHMHILSSGHLPIGAVIAGFIGTEY